MPDPLDQPTHVVARDEPQSQRMAKPRATSLAESPERMMHPLPNRLHRCPAITKLARLPVHYSVLRCTLRPSGRSSAAVPAVASLSGVPIFSRPGFNPDLLGRCSSP